MFEAEFVPDQLEFFPAIALACWVESYRSFVSYWLLNYLGSSECDLSFSIYQLPDLFVHNMPRRRQRSLSPSRKRMFTVADSSTNNVTNLRDVIDVPVPVVDVGDSSLRVPSLLSD